MHSTTIEWWVYNTTTRYTKHRLDQVIHIQDLWSKIGNHIIVYLTQLLLVHITNRIPLRLAIHISIKQKAYSISQDFLNKPETNQWLNMSFNILRNRYINVHIFLSLVYPEKLPSHSRKRFRLFLGSLYINIRIRNHTTQVRNEIGIRIFSRKEFTALYYHNI